MNNVQGSLKEYDCSICRNKGCIYTVRDNGASSLIRYEIVTKPCKCKMIRREILRMKDSGLSKIAKKNTFNSYKTEEDWQQFIKKSALSYAKEPNGWFFIGGQSGCGKTHICTAIVTYLLRKGRVAKYMLWQDDIARLKQLSNDYDRFDDVFNCYRKVDVLYIDDFFKIAGDDILTKADINMTLRLINFRYNENLTTIISSEKSMQEIISIDEALGSRIAEMCGRNAVIVKKSPDRNYRFKLGNGEI